MLTERTTRVMQIVEHSYVLSEVALFKVGRISQD
jgi:hypothetical protein